MENSSRRKLLESTDPSGTISVEMKKLSRFERLSPNKTWIFGVRSTTDNSKGVVKVPVSHLSATISPSRLLEMRKIERSQPISIPKRVSSGHHLSLAHRILAS